MGNVQIFNWINAHGIICIVSWILLSSAISAMESPTKDSSAFYRWFFAFANGSILNLKRLFPKIESSPNFNDGVIKAINGGTFTQQFIPNPNYKDKDNSESALAAAIEKARKE